MPSNTVAAESSGAQSKGISSAASRPKTVKNGWLTAVNASHAAQSFENQRMTDPKWRLSTSGEYLAAILAHNEAGLRTARDVSGIASFITSQGGEWLCTHENYSPKLPQWSEIASKDAPQDLATAFADQQRMIQELPDGAIWDSETE